MAEVFTCHSVKTFDSQQVPGYQSEVLRSSTCISIVWNVMISILISALLLLAIERSSSARLFCVKDH
jgi:hypothetical protein